MEEEDPVTRRAWCGSLARVTVQAEPRNPLTCGDLSEEISRSLSLITKEAASRRHTVMGYGSVIRMGEGVEKEIDLW